MDATLIILSGHAIVIGFAIACLLKVDEVVFGLSGDDINNLFREEV